MAETVVDVPETSVERPAHSTFAPRLLFESALIVLSVLLGLALNSWQERRREHDLAEQAITNFRREISANLAVLEKSEPRHRVLMQRLDSAARATHPGESAFTAFATVIHDGGVATEPLRDAAWETAVSTGALRLLDYDRASALSEVYLIQRTSLGATLRLLSDRFMMPQNFDPATRGTMLQTHRMLLNELAGQESYLIDVYRRTLQGLGR